MESAQRMRARAKDNGSGNGPENRHGSRVESAPRTNGESTMKIPYRFPTVCFGLMFGVVAASGLAVAQDPTAVPVPQSNGGWHRVGDTNPNPSPTPTPTRNDSSVTDPNANPDNTSADPQAAPPSLPAHLTIQTGTYVTVRLNQALSSDRNQAGDAFSATLVRPIVVDGVVVAASGQTLGGHVTEAKKAGRVEGTSRLGIQLTDLPVVDGQQVPVQTQFITRNGPTSVGRDAGAIGVTTAAGAAIGAGVGGAGGAAVGAGAGLLVSTVGVLLTRGHPTILYPETVMTFRVEQPVAISTEHAPQAFRYVDQRDYQQAGAPRMQPGGPGYGAPGYGAPGYAAGYAAPPPYYGPGYYPPYGYGYGYGYPYYGPGFGVFIGGPRFYGPGFGFRGRFR